MSFCSKLREKLDGKLPAKALDALPRSYFLVGDVVTLKLAKETAAHKRQIGKAILDILPYARSVLLIKSIDDAERTPKTEVIAGSRKTETVHKEHGCFYALDPAKIMWSKGNKEERKRMSLVTERGETAVDMFAGIGYWTIPMAKYGNVKAVTAIDVNPTAIKYLKKNVGLNRLNNVTIIQGRCEEQAEKLAESADRVVMGYLHGTERYLDAALRIARMNGVIHFHDILPQSKVPARLDQLKAAACKKGVFLDVMDIQVVKSYSPGVYHLVYDLRKE